MKYQTETFLVIGAAVAVYFILRARAKSEELRPSTEELRPFTYADIPTTRRGEINAAKLGIQ